MLVGSSDHSIDTILSPISGLISATLLLGFLKKASVPPEVTVNSFMNVEISQLLM